MSQARAWMAQAESDLRCAGRLLDPEDGTTFCHAVAKSQQAVEKAIKALVAELGMSVGWRHPVEPFLSALSATVGPAVGATSEA